MKVWNRIEEGLYGASTYFNRVGHCKVQLDLVTAVVYRSVLSLWQLVGSQGHA